MVMQMHSHQISNANNPPLMLFEHRLDLLMGLRLVTAIPMDFQMAIHSDFPMVMGLLTAILTAIPKD